MVGTDFMAINKDNVKMCSYVPTIFPTSLQVILIYPYLCVYSSLYTLLQIKVGTVVTKRKSALLSALFCSCQ